MFESCATRTTGKLADISNTLANANFYNLMTGVRHWSGHIWGKVRDKLRAWFSSDIHSFDLASQMSGERLKTEREKMMRRGYRSQAYSWRGSTGTSTGPHSLKWLWYLIPSSDFITAQDYTIKEQLHDETGTANAVFMGAQCHILLRGAASRGGSEKHVHNGRMKGTKGVHICTPHSSSMHGTLSALAWHHVAVLVIWPVFFCHSFLSIDFYNSYKTNESNHQSIIFHKAQWSLKVWREKKFNKNRTGIYWSIGTKLCVLALQTPTSLLMSPLGFCFFDHSPLTSDREDIKLCALQAPRCWGWYGAKFIILFFFPWLFFIWQFENFL